MDTSTPGSNTPIPDSALFASATKIRDFRPAPGSVSSAMVLSEIVAGYPARQSELHRLSVDYRRDPTPESARRYIMALEALVATALRGQAFSGPAGLVPAESTPA